MRQLLSTYGSRGGSEPMVRLAVQLRVLATADEGRDAPAVTGVTPIGAWQ